MDLPPLYLDNAATSFPKPAAVRAAMLDYMDFNGASAGRGAYREAYSAAKILSGCRDAVAKLLRVDSPSRLTFCLNCTDALNLGLKGVLREGDHVVTTWMDHNSILRPLARLENDGLITVTRVRAERNGCVDPNALRSAINDQTRMVATLHASNVSGSVQDVQAIGALCRERDLIFLLDAAQTIGTRVSK
jgi:selenocysteine lyase/cysteine desulfurase